MVGYNYKRPDNRIDTAHIAHLFGHTIGLLHPFSEGNEHQINTLLNRKKIAHRNPDHTNNIMSYNLTYLETLWRWQWKIINDTTFTD